MSLRVIAGSRKRQALSTPPGLATRPTSGRVREAVFSILHDVSGLRVLDLYAGSGALGIEALSRGADFAVFVESARPALGCIRDNLSRLELTEHARVLASDAERISSASWLALSPLHLVFCDPPWAELARALAIFPALAPALAADSRIVLEHPRRESPTLEGLACLDRRHWGDTGVSFFQKT